MAITQNTFTGNGSNLGPFSFTFKWLESTDIKVSVGGVLKTAGTHYNLQSLNYTTKTGGQVLFTAGNTPANGASIRIFRDTDDEALSAVFSSGSAIRARDLNDNFTQNLYVTQEVNNNAVTIDGSNPMVGDLSMGSYKITNLAAPTTDTDAVNRAYVNNIVANGIGDGDKGDITVSGSGSTLTIDNGIITNAKVNSGAAIVSSKLAFTQAGTGAVQRTVESKLQDVVSVLDFIPESEHAAIKAGTTNYDATAAIQAAINTANVIELPFGNYKVSTTINLGNGKTLQGSGKLIASASLTGGVIGFWANNATLKGITINCNAVPSNIACRGVTIINPGLTNLIIDSVTVESASFTGIDIFRPSGTASHTNVQIKNCTVVNSGWEGISVTGGDGILIDNCRVISSGYNGINLWKSGTNNAVITSNYVNRAVPPSRGVFNSQAESGGLLYLGPGAGNIVISNNVLVDNRNAGDDGIILGEDGTVDFNSVVISGNVVEYAGQFGIDAHSNFTVTGNTVKNARNVGIFIGADLGGTVKNITVTGNNILNTGTATHAGIGINITSNQGNANYFKHIQITGNLVVDDRTPQYTSAGLGINLQDAYFENVVVKGNNFKKCATPIAYYNTGYAGEIYVGDNQVDMPKALTGTTSTYSVRGANYFTLDPGAIHTVTDFTDGYQGQEITIVFLRGDTTLDLSGSLMKAGTLTSYTPQAFSAHKATKIGATWYWQI